MTDKVVIFGSTGMLGNVVSKYLKQSKLYDVIDIPTSGFDILNDSIENLRPMLVNYNDYLTVIINCAGIVKPRIKNMSVEEVLKINSAFPIQLSKYVSRLTEAGHDVAMIHISTDCVFTGNRGNYRSDDIPDATDLYGMSKSLGEACESTDTLVIRTSIIGEELANKYSLLEWAISQKGKEVQGWTDHIWSGVTTLELAKYIDGLLSNGLDNGQTEDLITYASRAINKFDLLTMINTVYHLGLTINKTTGPNPCDRSLVCDTWDPPGLLKQLTEMKEFFDECR